MILGTGKCLVLSFLITLAFFRMKSFPIPAAAALVFLLIRERKRRRAAELAEKKKQFCDALTTMSGLLLTGHPLELVFGETGSSLERIYGPGSYMASEFYRMDLGIRLNHTGEQVLTEFAKRSGLPEAEQLAGLISYVRRNNGKADEVCGNLAYQMSKSFETESEIRKILSSGRTELSLMRILPPAILNLLSFTDPAFLSYLYQDSRGRLFSLVCFVCYFGIWIITDRMVGE